ncbi:MAG: hypothetical protein HDQ96_05160 [Lachnospiraceae bacterium]|nr:hypothetical protein [Lachnospiraceae bacterium]
MTIFLLALSLALCGCGQIEIVKEETVYPDSREEENQEIKDEQEEENYSEKNALHQFAEYLNNIIKSGNRDDLNQYIVSKVVAWNEAGDIALKEEAFRHFKDYEQYYFNSDGAVIVEADVNGDGIADIIEYLPLIGDHQMSQSNLTIYVSEGDGYRVLYYVNFGIPYS